MVLLLLTFCLLLLLLWESVTVLCFVVCYFMSILVLQLSWWGRESWLLCLICLPGVSLWFRGSSWRCHGVVCGLWLWYFLIILTIFYCNCWYVVDEKSIQTVSFLRQQWFLYLRILYLLLIILSLGCKVFISASPRMQWYCRLVIKKWCSWLISLQLDPLIWETASPRTHEPKIVNESLRQDLIYLFLSSRS